MEAKLSRKASFYNPEKISIGDFTRIDDFCILSAGEGGIEIGRNVHIAICTSLIGLGKIKICDFANISSRVAIYSSNDDYSGEYMTNPTVDSRYTNVHSAPITIGEHVIIGSGSIVLPGVTLAQGVSIGALSLVNKDCEAFKMYAGVPAHYLKDRSRNLLKLTKRFLGEES
ncbi:MAG: acyltransferase [Candidatus Omnitrophota bacterium]|nr:acyltransferase [Candidatus Omnitrophota bacterium]